MIIPNTKKVMHRYVLMFGFGIIFMIVMTVQNLFLKPLFSIAAISVELVGVYFMIKSFVKRELNGI